MSNESIDASTQSLWDRAKTILVSTLQNDDDRSQAERYFGMIRHVDFADGIFTIYTINKFAADLLKRDYANKLQSSFNLAGAPADLVVEFKIDETSKPTIVIPTVEKTKENPIPVQRQNRVSTFVSTMPMNPDYTFDEFVPGPSNSYALSSAKAIVKKPGKNGFYNPFFIYGGTGLGKTHLMQAIGNDIVKNDPSLSVCYLTAETFLNEYVNSLQNGAIQSFRDKYRKIDVLLLDDVQFLQKGDNVQEEFFNTFNALQGKKKQIVMTSDVAPKKMPALEERLISRFEGGMVQEIESPSYETRLAILKKKVASLDTNVPLSALEFIADKIKSHVRAMEGALSKVCMCHMANPGMMLTNEVLNNLLKEIIEKEQSLRKLTIEEIQEAVAKKFNITVEQILSTERTQSLVTPRQLAMFIARQLTPKSLQEIAAAFEKKHATILHGVKTIRFRIDNEVDLRCNLEDVVTQFGYKLDDVLN